MNHKYDMLFVFFAVFFPVISAENRVYFSVKQCFVSFFEKNLEYVK